MFWKTEIHIDYTGQTPHRNMQKNEEIYIQTNKYQMEKPFGSTVIYRTKQNRLHGYGYSFRKAKTKSILSKKHRPERFGWDKQHKKWTTDDLN